MVEVFTTYLNKRKQSEFIDALKLMDIRCVVDIRYSFNYPAYYRPREMEILLEENDISYLRFHALGNPPEIRYMDDATKRKEMYMSHILNGKEPTLEFKLVYRTIRLDHSKYCLICYCAPPMECHRFWLKEMLENDSIVIPDIWIDVT